MTTRMQQRRGLAAQWTTGNPVLGSGEIGFETDTNKFKIGNGQTAWADLKYFLNIEALDTDTQGFIRDNQKAAANGIASLDGNGKIPVAQLGNLIDGAPAALDTLNEIATLIGNGSSITGSLITNIGALNTEISNHEAATTTVHGIADTSLLATKTYATSAASNATTTHANLTTSVHGIANTAQLATLTNVTAAVTTATNYTDSAITLHEADTTSVHGIANTANLALKSYVDTAVTGMATQAYVTSAVTTHESDTTAVHGITDTTALATKTYADSAVTTHTAATTSVHGISNTANLVYTSDSRLSDTRTPIDSSVTTAKIAPDAVTTSKILDANVTTSKILDANVTTVKIADSAVTSAKIASATIVDANISSSAAIAQSKISGLSTSLGLKADLASPALTGTPTAPTAVAGTNTTQVATTAFVGTAVSNLVASAPAALDTLNELATALGNDASFSTTITNSIALKAPIASPTFTGTVTLPAGGIVFSDGTQSKEGVPSRTPIVAKTASYTLSALTERDAVVEVNSASAVTVTVPLNATVAYPVGTSIDILQTGAGQITVAATAGVTVNATPGLKLRAQWSGATLFKRATDTWVLYGDLSA